ncbi:MAG: hypothetical protein JW793_00160 [Acidobacteria bacterium]|nr:hypothetical protein [Acidobacteriota bacterium]
MLLNSIYRILNQQAGSREADGAGINAAPSKPDAGAEEFSKVAEKVRIPAGEATLEAAAKAKGMKKIELEIAAAAGLLRPISPEPPGKPNRHARGLDDLLRTIGELKDPPRSPNLDLFK